MALWHPRIVWVRFWHGLDTWSHEQTWIPERLQDWICDRVDKVYGA
jgi:hypothetical protein